MQLAMELVVSVGEKYGAKRLLQVKKAHIDVCSASSFGPATVDFLRYLVEHGVRVSVPTTINSGSRDRYIGREIGCSEACIKGSQVVEDIFTRMGVLQTWTCAPYQCANIPRFGENVAWSESNAVCYVNSVIGARTERLPDMFEVCCAAVARVPEYGYYLTENRRGHVLFQLQGFDESWFQDSVDYALLGYYVGQHMVNGVPVIQGAPEGTDNDNLKAFGAAAASGGGIGLFHMVGCTPEAPTVAAAFQGWTGYDTQIITPEALVSLKRTLCTAADNRVDYVIMGCPHYSVNELGRVAQLLAGRKVNPATALWVMTSDPQYYIAEKSGIITTLQEAGAIIVRDTCPMNAALDWSGKTVMTDSGKVAQYAPAINHVKIHMGSAAACVEAAICGQVCKGDKG